LEPVETGCGGWSSTSKKEILFSQNHESYEFHVTSNNRQARSQQVLRFWEVQYTFRGKIFVLIICLQQNFWA